MNMQYALVLLLVVIAVSARHHKHEDTSDLAPDTAQAEENIPEAHAKRQRRKRWYSSYGYQAPGYREEGLHGSHSPPPATVPYDPFAYIYRRLDELTAVFRQPITPPPTPILVPYPVYINSSPCTCQPGTGQPQQPTGPQQPLEPMPNITIPNRVGPTGDDDDYDDIPLRPLSFDPVKPDRPLSRPIPAVEHGSTQEGAPVPTGREPSSFSLGSNTPITSTPTPSKCDVAILTCCHQRYTTNQCFNSFGCSSVLRSPNPCDTRTISNVVSIFQNFYRNN